MVEEEEEEVRGEEGGKERGGGAPISPDASLADGLLLLGKITPLVIRSPRWLYYLHGRAFVFVAGESETVTEEGGGEGERLGED